MRALALIALLLPLTAEAGMLGGGRGLLKARTSPTAARYEFTTTGGDWPVPPEAPAPVVDCRGDFRSGACGATTFTPSGTPALASTYWRPGGGSVAGSGVAFDGVDDLLSAPTAATCAGDQFACVRFTPGKASGVQVLMSRDAGSPNQDFLFFLTSIGQVQAAIYTASGTSLIQLGTVEVGLEYVACFAYDYTANGTSVLRGNLSGVVPSEVTNAKGPPNGAGVTVATTIGANGATPAAAPFKGTISGAIRGCYAPTAADLSRMVNAQYAKQGSLGEPLTVTRASSKTCTIGGAWYSVPAGQPCIGDAGLSVEGSRTNRILQSADMATTWSTVGEGVVSSNADVAPDGTLTADRITVGAVAVKSIYQGTTGHAANAALAFSFWIKRVSTTGSLLVKNVSGSTLGLWSIDLSKLPDSFVRLTASHAAVTVGNAFVASDVGGGGARFYSSDGGELTASVWGFQQEEGSTASSYIATTTTPVTRAADVVNIANPGIFSQGCINVTASAPAWPASYLAATGKTGDGSWASIEYTIANRVQVAVLTGAAYKVWYYAVPVPWVAGSEHIVTACFSGLTFSSLIVDGAVVATTEGGTGAATLSAEQAAIYIGAVSNGASSFGGSAKSVTLCRSPIPSECN